MGTLAAMLVRILDVLDPPTLDAVRSKLGDPALFENGAGTAGTRARRVKHNLQARAGDAAVRGVLRLIEKTLAGNGVFQAAARPAHTARILISRYETGMEYGTHIDAPMIDGVRTDLSFTLFLSDPAGYEGGALVIDTGGAEEEVKLPAGAMVLYPSSYLHRVQPVTAGVRLAAVGWVKSHIRAEDRRDLLFDLDSTVARLAETGADNAALDGLGKIRANLLRMWVDD